MDGTMSQEEINALLNSPTVSDEEGHKELLSEREIDAIGEIGRSVLGTAATTLFSLVNRGGSSQRRASHGEWDDVCEAYEKPCVFIRIGYTVA